MIEDTLRPCEERCYVIWLEMKNFAGRSCATDLFHVVGNCPMNERLSYDANNFVSWRIIDSGKLIGGSFMACCGEVSSLR